MLCVLFNPAHKTLISKRSIQDCNDCYYAQPRRPAQRPCGTGAHSQDVVQRSTPEYVR